MLVADKQPGVFWGAVNTALSEDGQSKLPPMDDKKVQYLATVMFYFFIICIILLVVYLVCSILLIWGAAKVSKKNLLLHYEHWYHVKFDLTSSSAVIFVTNVEQIHKLVF